MALGRMKSEPNRNKKQKKVKSNILCCIETICNSDGKMGKGFLEMATMLDCISG